MKSLINNLINGNLADAKAQAKKYSYLQIWNYLYSECGWLAKQAGPAARYLKNPTQENYNNYCNWNK